MNERFSSLDQFKDALRRHPQHLPLFGPECQRNEAEKLDFQFRNLLNNADRSPEFLVKVCRFLDVPTPREHEVDIAGRSALAAEQAVVIARNSDIKNRVANWIAFGAFIVATLTLFLKNTLLDN
jgi:hypothetical protein